MKKTICFCLIFSFIVLLVGCTKSFYYDYEEMKDEIEKIEIINIHQYDGTLYPDKDKDCDLLKILIGEEKDELLLDLSKIKITFFHGSPNYSPVGLCLKLYYEDQTYGFMNHYTFFKFNKDGTKYVYSKNAHALEEEFNNLLSKFIEIS